MIPFNTWVAFVFDHPATGPEWYWDDAADAEIARHTADHETTVRNMTRLFAEPAVLAKYDRAQIGQGIWFLVGEASPAAMAHRVNDGSVAVETSLACLAALPAFFAHLATLCTDPLPVSHTNRDEPLAIAVYMFWDIWPSWGASTDPRVDRATLDAMARIGDTTNVACAESALHGLGHWRHRHPARVEAIVGALLASAAAKAWPPELHRYAEAARRGCVA